MCQPRAAERDASVRDRLLAQLTERIAGSDALSATQRAELRGALRTQPGLHRYLRVTPGGLLRVDRSAVRREAHLDGKWLLRCSDPSLSAEDIAVGYKQLLEVRTPFPPTLPFRSRHSNRRRERRVATSGALRDPQMRQGSPFLDAPA